MEKEHRQELRNNLAAALFNLALALERRGSIQESLKSVRGARQLWEDAVKDGMKHLAPSLNRAEVLQARLINRLF